MSASIAFPSIGHILSDGYTHEFEDHISKVPMEVGSARHRRMYASVARLFSLTMAFTGDEYRQYVEWLNGPANNGAAEFDIQLADDSDELIWYTVQLLEPPTALVVGLNSDDWRVSMRLRSQKPAFAVRPPGTNQLRGISEPELMGTGRLVIGRPMRGLSTPELSASGRFRLGPLRGLGYPVTVNSGRLGRYFLRGSSELGATGTGKFNSADPPVRIVLGRFDGTNGQTSGVANEGTLGGNFTLSGSSQLSTTQVQYGSTSLQAPILAAGTRISWLGSAGASRSVFNITSSCWIWMPNSSGLSLGTLASEIIFIYKNGSGGGGSDPSHAARLTGDSSSTFRLYAQYASSFNSSAFAVLSRGAWHHFLMSTDASGTVRWFINGVLQATTWTVSSGSMNLHPYTFVVSHGQDNVSPMYIDDLAMDTGRQVTASFTPPGAL